MHKLCSTVKLYGPLIARIFMAQLFILSALGQFGAFAKTAAFLANSGLPMPDVLLVVAIIIELGGSILLLLGWHARYAAVGLCAFTLIVTFVLHAFWNAEPGAFTNQLNNFMKNFAIMGGLLYIMAYGAGPLSLGKERCDQASS